MPVSEATFGAVGKSHAIIATTPAAAKIAPRIVGRTDLPNTPPSGVEWSSYESGYLDGDTYILSRTWPDPSALRAGMVFTHALIAPFSEIDSADGLLQLIARLPSKLDRAAALKEEPLLSVAASPTAPRAHQLFDAMLDGSRPGPIVWLGEADLLPSLVALWRHLPSAVRRTIAFRLSFGPEDVAIVPPLVVTTPRALVQRWKGRTIIDPTLEPLAASGIAQSILSPTSAEDIAAYAKNYGVTVRSLNELVLLQKSWETARARGKEFDSLLSQFRIIMALSPKREPGEAHKAKLIADLATAVGTASAVQVSALRNIDTSTWSNGASLWLALRSAAADLAARDSCTAADLALWRQATADAGQSPWVTAMRNGFDDAAKGATTGTFWATWWQRWNAAPELIAPVFALLPAHQQLEEALAGTAPTSITISTADPIMSAAADKKWWVLHAISARRSRSLHAALERQLLVDTDLTHDAGIVALIEDTPGSDLVTSALTVADPRLLELAGRAASIDPSLLAPFDPASLSWRGIWRSALALNSAAWRGVANPRHTRLALVQQLRAGATLEPEFLQEFASTPLADLSDVPGRNDLWERLPEPAREGFLVATAIGWLDGFANRQWDARDAEPILRRAIVAPPARDAFLAVNGGSTDAVLRYFETFDELPENLVARWLRDLRDNQVTLSQSEATRLGRLVNNRQWKTTAAAIASLLHTDDRQTFAPAAFLLRGIFYWSDLALLLMKGVLSVNSSQDVWTVFEEVACDLYPSGPNETELWSRAGGRKSDLPSGQTGRARWHATVAFLRNGRARLAPGELLAAMIEEHPRNEQLAWLAKQAVFIED